MAHLLQFYQQLPGTVVFLISSCSMCFKNLNHEVDNDYSVFFEVSARGLKGDIVYLD